MSASRLLAPRARRYRWSVLALVIALAGSAALIALDRSAGRAISPSASEHDVTSWAPPGTRPLSDAQAAALVTPQPETQPTNATANDYTPTAAQLAAFSAAQRSAAQAGAFADPLIAYVTGRPGITNPSTDDLIQWVSHKWGIPTNWIRAQMVVESRWNQSQRGDPEPVSARWYQIYPEFSRIAGTSSVYQSLGIAQEKWLPDGSVGAGTEPLRWESTAFSLDFYAASLRYYYNGACSWCSAGYRPGQDWESIGAWYSPQPWNNVGARNYISEVQAALSEHPWTQSGF